MFLYSQFSMKTFCMKIFIHNLAQICMVAQSLAIVFRAQGSKVLFLSLCVFAAVYSIWLQKWTGME